MKENLIEFIYKMPHFKNDRSLKLDADTKLISTGMITSIDIINLVNHMEKQFGIEVFVEDVTPENFETINCLENYIKRKS